MCVRTSGSRSDTSKDWYFENATINSTVKLVQGLMKKYNVPLSRVVRHYDVVGKYCPNPFVLNDDPVTWSSFKSMVAGDKDLPPDTGSSSTSGKPSAPSTGGSVSASGINVRYQTYVNGQWLPWVTNYNNISQTATQDPVQGDHRTESVYSWLPVGSWKFAVPGTPKGRPMAAMGDGCIRKGSE